jgi:ABC-type multidrug transport system fused ATPase/permease subunit
MNRDTREIVRLILKFIEHKPSFFFWTFVRFVSALFPMLSIYLFSLVIKYLDNQTSFSQLIQLILIIIIVFILDNFTRLLSIYCLQDLISQTEFGIHRLLTVNLRSPDKKVRHKTIQAIRNLGEAVRTTLEIIRQPGIDSFVSLIAIPSILLFLDFKVFILEVAYVLVYYFTDVFTTERYSSLKDIQNQRTEVYYAKLQESNEIESESKTYTRHFKDLCRWGFVEWFSLQNIAVSFYTLILFYLASEFYHGSKQISDLVLIMGYISSTQVFLNSLSTVKDRLADTKVALRRLAKNPLLSVDFSDLT